MYPEMPSVLLLAPSFPAATIAASFSFSAGGGEARRKSQTQRQQRSAAIVDYATMFSNLKRCGGSALFWERRTSSCRRTWTELSGARVVGFGTSATSCPSAAHAQLEKRRERLGGNCSGAKELHGNSSSNGARSSAASGRGAVTAGLHPGVSSGIYRDLAAAYEGHGLVGARGRLASLSVLGPSGRHELSYGWKRRQRRGDLWISNDYKYTEVVETHQPRRVYNAASHANAATAPDTSAEAVVRKGALVEFERESGKVVLAVAQSRDGKKNWTAIDQSGNTHVVRPQQITYLVPSEADFEPSDIATFNSKAESLEDFALLEVAWEEVLAEKVVHAEGLAKILYSRDSPVECYTVHRMLSSSQLYFRCKQKGLTPIYEPRPLSQVKELQQQRLADERAHEQLLSYVVEVKSALKRPLNDKPPQSTWREVEHFRSLTESLEAYSLGLRSNPAQKKLAEGALEAMGLIKNPAVVVNLLIGMGVYPFHVNIELLKVKTLVNFTEDHIAAAKDLDENPRADPDLVNRVDLTDLKVYTIDSDDTDEIDDGLSAARLSDGRLKVWIHVADPTRLVPYENVLCREAEFRGTSIYLPTGTIPMFPMELAAGQMSLRQGRDCCAVTVSVIIHEDGSIAEYSVMNSTIRPTYKLSYENVAELLFIKMDEEPELYLLAEAASCRAKWRLSQGAILTFVPEPDIKVIDPHLLEPSIVLGVKDQSGPAMQLVAEMMILCGEAISMMGAEKGLCLPYRGQAQTDVPKRVVTSVPEGPCRAFAMRRLLGGADLSYSQPKPHASLGLPGYVQFTSPIRRSADFLAHYQVKAHLRGEKTPLTRGHLESKMALANARTKEARRLQTASERYWVIEYLRRQPKDRRYKAVVLRQLRDKEVIVLLLEIAFRCGLVLASTPSVGTEITVLVVNADPRKDVITLKQC